MPYKVFPYWNTLKRRFPYLQDPSRCTSMLRKSWTIIRVNSNINLISITFLLKLIWKNPLEIALWSVKWYNWSRNLAFFNYKLRLCWTCLSSFAKFWRTKAKICWTKTWNSKNKTRLSRWLIWCLSPILFKSIWTLFRSKIWMNALICFQSNIAWSTN